ncbi:MAG: formylglycine-generating enzyme family protein [Kiritimatiellia bacterium]
MKKVLIGMMTMFVSMSAMADDPTIDGVMVQQRWPWSRLVDIDYVLTCDLEQSMDIVVKAYNGSNLLDVPETSFSGDLNGVACGARRIVWDPAMTSYTNNGVLPKFCVALTPSPTPLYMIVDLTKSAGETGQTEYVYESDLTNGLWGAWVRNPVTNRGTVVQSVVWTGVTTNDIYKTDKLVLRRISKGEFKMGDTDPPTLSTTLTKDFYAGVFEMTQKQWEEIMGANPSEFKDPINPVEKVRYNDIRGTAALGGGGWPTNSNVYVNSFVGRLRTKTGRVGFDLPTEAQWEYACRAGTTTLFNNGKISGTATNHMDELSWCKHNSGDKTHPVGQKVPNAWGLYDMHGNVSELGLDWHFWILQGGEDPAGPLWNTDRVRRGGCWNYEAANCRSGFRSSRPPHGYDSHLGFRIVMTLP